MRHHGQATPGLGRGIAQQSEFLQPRDYLLRGGNAYEAGGSHNLAETGQYQRASSPANAPLAVRRINPMLTTPEQEGLLLTQDFESVLELGVVLEDLLSREALGLARGVRLLALLQLDLDVRLDA